MHEQHIIIPNSSFCYFFTTSSMTGISSEHLFYSSCWEGDTRATHFRLKWLLNQDSCKTKLGFLCHILESKLIGLESVCLVLVDLENEQVERRAASNLVEIFYAILNPN
jgi:hypothetical protein